VSATPKVRQIAIEKLTKLQVRAAECEATVETYTEIYARKGKEEVQMPPLQVFKVGDDLLIVDGNHRRTGAELAGRGFLPCVIVGSGTLEDAQGFAIRCNHDHGLRRTNEDKRKAVNIAIDLGWLDELGSNRAVAKDLGVSEKLVRIVLKERRPDKADTKAGADIRSSEADAASPPEPTEGAGADDATQDTTASTRAPTDLAKVQQIARLASKIVKDLRHQLAGIEKPGPALFPNAIALRDDLLEAAKVFEREARAAEFEAASKGVC